MEVPKSFSDLIRFFLELVDPAVLHMIVKFYSDPISPFRGEPPTKSAPTAGGTVKWDQDTTLNSPCDPFRTSNKNISYLVKKKRAERDLSLLFIVQCIYKSRTSLMYKVSQY